MATYIPILFSCKCHRKIWSQDVVMKMQQFSIAIHDYGVVAIPLSQLDCITQYVACLDAVTQCATMPKWQSSIFQTLHNLLKVLVPVTLLLNLGTFFFFMPNLWHLVHIIVLVYYWKHLTAVSFNDVFELCMPLAKTATNYQSWFYKTDVTYTRLGVWSKW